MSTGMRSGTSPANTISPPGDYPSSVSGQTVPNYAIAYQEGTLTVTGAVLLIAIDDVVRPYGTENPLFTGTINGIANGDNLTASFTASATSASSAGIYPITMVLGDADGKLRNYNL